MSVPGFDGTPFGDDIVDAISVARSHAGADNRPDTREERRMRLSMALYGEWFTRSTAHPLSGMDPAASGRLVAVLRAAHAGTGVFETGWAAESVGQHGRIVARKDTGRLELSPPDYVNLDHVAVPVRVGDRLAVTRRRDDVDDENGWWLTYARAGAAPDTRMVRVYWNCPPRSAPELIAALTSVLEDRQVPYTLKCPVDGSLFARVDVVVLYLGIGVFDEIKGVLATVHSAMETQLRQGVPPLTLQLGDGVAAAEDPGEGHSFGQSRCAAVADGIIRAFDDGVDDESEIAAAILDSLESYGISPSRPYQNLGSPPGLVTSW